MLWWCPSPCGACADEELNGPEGHQAAKISGTLTVTGRYHHLPNLLSDQYILSDKVLGAGINGKVFQASSKVTGELFAVKTVNLKGVPKSIQQELQNEVEIFLSMDHPHIARLVDVFESPDQVQLVMECMSGGELFNCVQKKQKLSEQEAASVVWQMLLAVNYMHSCGVVHRDIKLENFLFEQRRSHHLKLIDFGLSKILPPDSKMEVSCGTLAYVAPEVLMKSYTSKCDMWSVGVVAFILLAGYMPFQGQEAAQVRAIKAGRYLYKDSVWKKVSKSAHEFVNKLLVVSPDDRLSAPEALKDMWIVKNHGKEVLRFDDDIAVALASFAQASKFRRSCLFVMAMSLTSQEQAEVRKVFLSMDRDKKGSIALSDFRTLLGEHFSVQDSEVTGIFEALNMNKTEEIHYSEFLAAMVFTRIGVHDEMVRSAFRRFDVSNTGYITENDLRVMLGDDALDLKEVMRVVNTAHDGRISIDEFVEYVKHPLKNETSKARVKITVERKTDSEKRILPKIPSERTRGRAISYRACEQEDEEDEDGEE